MKFVHKMSDLLRFVQGGGPIKIFIHDSIDIDDRIEWSFDS